MGNEPCHPWKPRCDQSPARARQTCLFSYKQFDKNTIRIFGEVTRAWLQIVGRLHHIDSVCGGKIFGKTKVHKKGLFDWIVGHFTGIGKCWHKTYRFGPRHHHHHVPCKQNEKKSTQKIIIRKLGQSKILFIVSFCSSGYADEFQNGSGGWCCNCWFR